MKKILISYLCLIALFDMLMHIAILLCPIDINCIYKSAIRSTLFTAFLTMGSFMLSLMSMFMFSLKDKLFDDTEYIKLYIAKEKISGKINSIYSPLVNISRLFLFCVMMCFITSLSQFTVGLINCNAASIFCLSLAVSTITLALYVLYNVWRNLEVWFCILLKGKAK